jgi:hypothetical protein
MQPSAAMLLFRKKTKTKRCSLSLFFCWQKKKKRGMAARQREGLISPVEFFAEAWATYINGVSEPDIARADLMRRARETNLAKFKPGSFEQIIKLIAEQIYDAYAPRSQKKLYELAEVARGPEWLAKYTLWRSAEVGDDLYKVSYVLSHPDEVPADGDFSDSEIAAALRATLGNEVAAAAMLKKKKTRQ